MFQFFVLRAFSDKISNVSLLLLLLLFSYEEYFVHPKSTIFGSFSYYTLWVSSQIAMIIINKIKFADSACEIKVMLNL